LKFSQTIVQAFTREISDHTPLFLNIGDSSMSGSIPTSRFELGWLLREGIFYMVKEVWTEVHEGHTPLERWQGKIRCLCQHLTGWAKNISSACKKEKKCLIN